MKKNKLTTIIVIILVSLTFTVSYFNKKNKTEPSSTKEVQEVLNYNIRIGFEKNNTPVSSLDLITTDNGLFNYDINFQFEGNSTKFDIILLLDYKPQNFSLDDDEFSMKKNICVNSSTKHNIKFKNKITGTSAFDLILVPDNIKENPGAINGIIYLNGFLNNEPSNKNKFNNKNLITKNGQNISNDENFSFLVNTEYKNGKLNQNSEIIKCKANEKIDIPVVGDSHGNPDCNYMVFLNNDIVKLNNNNTDTFSKSFKITNGNIFSDTLSITAPNKNGQYILWVLAHYDLYGQEESNAVSSNNSIILQVGD